MSGGNISSTSIEKIGIFQWFFDCLFPKECLNCGQEGGYWCSMCQSLNEYSYPEKCLHCQKTESQNGICADCQPLYAFDGLIIATDYEEEMIGKLIRTCKYRFVKSLTLELSLLLKIAIINFLDLKPNNHLIDYRFFEATVIGVPLSSRRQKWRGFNQAELLAQYVADYCNLSFRQDLLSRVHRSPQANLNSVERLSNLKNTFKIQGEVPALVILVDDVITTGTTLHECAKVLKAKGAEEVWGLVVAKG